MSATKPMNAESLKAGLLESADKATRDALVSHGYTQFSRQFMATAPRELQQAFLPLSESQIHGIMQETLALFQRPAGLDDALIQKQVAAAGLPLERILADYHQRQSHLVEMAQSDIKKMGGRVKHALRSVVGASIGGIASTVATSLLLRKYAPETSRLGRFVGAIAAGVGGFLSIGFLAKAMAPSAASDPMYGQALERRLVLDAGFTGEILRMAAIHYAKDRADNLCPESKITEQNLAPDTPGQWAQHVTENAAKAGVGYVPRVA